MLRSRPWDKSPLAKLLKEVMFSPIFMSITIDYLGNEDISYLTMKEMSKIKKIPICKLESTQDKVFYLIKSYGYSIGILDEILDPVNEFLLKYKGAISVKTWITDFKSTQGYDSLTAIRTLRFAECIQNKIQIDTKKMLFWENRDVCVHCQKLKQSIEEQKRKGFMEWEKISGLCKSDKCHVKPQSYLDPGILDFHSFETKDEPSISPMLVSLNTKPIPISKPDKISSADVSVHLELSNESGKLLDYLIKNANGVIDSKLRAFGKLYGIDPYAAIAEINGSFYEKQQHELLIHDKELNMWRIDFGFLSVFKSQVSKGVNDTSNIQDSNLGVEFSTIDQPDQNLNAVCNAIENALTNARTSYKFYWAYAMLHCMKSNRLIVSLRDMSVLMCAYAWHDVMNVDYQYIDEDYLPSLLNGIRSKVSVSELDTIENISSNISQYIGNEDVRRLTVSVKDYFLAPTNRPANHIIEMQDRNQKLTDHRESRKVCEVYSYRGHEVYFEKSFWRLASKHSDKMFELIDRFKETRLLRRDKNQ